MDITSLCLIPPLSSDGGGLRSPALLALSKSEGITLTTTMRKGSISTNMRVQGHQCP